MQIPQCNILQWEKKNSGSIYSVISVWLSFNFCVFSLLTYHLRTYFQSSNSIQCTFDHARTATHWHASSRIVPTSSRRVQEQFAHSSRPSREILSWPKFWTFQNSRPDMARSHDGFTHTSRQFTTSLRTGTTRVVPMRATESCKCQPCFT